MLTESLYTWPTADEMRAEGLSPDTGRPYFEPAFELEPVRPGWLYRDPTYRVTYIGLEGIRAYIGGIPRADVVRTMRELSECGARDVRTC